MPSNSVLPRAYMEQSVSISAWKASSTSISFNFNFCCSHSCSSLYALVTVTNLTTYKAYQREFWGSGTTLSGSGVAAALESGTYRTVVTAYAPEPAMGMSSSYSQDWVTLSI